MATLTRTGHFAKVLVAVDDRTDGTALANAVLALTRPWAEIVALNVRQRLTSPPARGPVALLGSSDAPPVLTTLSAVFGDHGYRVDSALRESRRASVGDDIFDFADRMEPYLIAIGSRGFSDLHALFS